MTTKLAVYNDALLHLGERKLASLTESREPRRVLDDLWDANLAHCLEQGLWNFATRSIELAASDSITPTFGYANAFSKPDDWVRTVALSADETFNTPLTQVVDEGDYWFADVDPIYVRYVSNDTAYGLDLSRWPQTFADYVAVRLARKGCKRITQSTADLDDLRKDERRALSDARSKDAMNDPAAFPPTGSWVAARGGAESWRRRTKGY